MSSNLYWSPVKPESRGTLPYALKNALRNRYGSPLHITVSTGSVPYLEGMQDAGVEGAKELIELIEKYGEVRLDEEY